MGDTTYSPLDPMADLPAPLGWITVRITMIGVVARAPRQPECGRQP